MNGKEKHKRQVEFLNYCQGMWDYWRECNKNPEKFLDRETINQKLDTLHELCKKTQ